MLCNAGLVQPDRRFDFNGRLQLFSAKASGPIDRTIDHHRCIIEIDLILPGAPVGPAIEIEPHEAIGESVGPGFETIALAGLFVSCTALFGRHRYAAGQKTGNTQ